MGFSLRLERFCCCCSLRTGALVIGTAGWIFTFIELFYLVGPAVDKSENNYYNSEDNELDHDLQHFEQALENANRRNLFYQLGFGVVTLVICVLLVVGVYKKDRRFMLPWLVLKCFEAILTTLGTFLFFILGCTTTELKGIFFSLSLIFLIVSVIVWYTWLCVYSHYRETGEGDAMPPVYYAPNTMPPPAYQEPEKSKFGMA